MSAQGLTPDVAPRGRLMSRDDAEEWTQTLGLAAGATWRQIALAKRMGVPQALGLTVDQWVTERLGGYVKMAVEARREAVRELKDEGASTREIAEVLGVGTATVHRDISDAVPNGTRGKSDDKEINDLPDEGVPNGTPAPLDALTGLAAVERTRRAHVANNSGNVEQRKEATP